jgi:hypothetical protein
MTSSASTLELAVYRCFEDTLLFVPAVCRPPREAEAEFGPLCPAGTVRVAMTEPAWTPILDQIERHLFATVPREQGELLAGIAPMAQPSGA